MRIVVWNSNMALGRKFAAVAALRPDIAVISECGEGFSVPEGVSFVWAGKNVHKGIGVFGFGDFSVALDPSYDPRIQWVVPSALMARRRS